MYFRNTINVYFLFSHEWCVPLIKFMVRSTIHVRGRIHIYSTPGVLNNFLIFLILLYSLSHFIYLLLYVMKFIYAFLDE